jgi:RNA polymerase sigma-70 factor (ECF subfamily)
VIAGVLNEGEREVWQAAFARHRRRVVVALVARGWSLDGAEELAQEAWARVLEQAQRGALTIEEAKLPGLVITQARFFAADQARRERARTDGVVELADARASIEERLLKRQELERASAALAECPASAQEIFRLRYDEPGLGCEAVAERVGLSVQRVRQVICETRQKLRAAIDGENA